MDQDWKGFNIPAANGIGGGGGRKRRTMGHEDILSQAAKTKKLEAERIEKQVNKLRNINVKYSKLQKAEEEKRRIKCAKIRDKCKIEKEKLKTKKHDDLEAADVAYYDSMDRLEEKKEEEIRKLIGL